jgi:hypothetical protein
MASWGLGPMIQQLMNIQWYLLFPLTPKRLVLIVGKQSLMALPRVAVLMCGIPY